MIACRSCNEKKSNGCVDPFLKGKPDRFKKIKSQIKASLNDAAVINTIRFAIGERLKQFGLPLSFGTGGQTKFNRTNQGYQKHHWIDAVCVGRSGEWVSIPKRIHPLIIKATGRGSRQMCRVNKYGFPRTSAKKSKEVKGFYNW